MTIQGAQFYALAEEEEEADEEEEEEEKAWPTYLCLADIHGTLVRKNPPTVRKGPCGGVVPCPVFPFRLLCLYRAAPSSGSHVVGALLRGRNARATGRDIRYSCQPSDSELSVGE